MKKGTWIPTPLISDPIINYPSPFLGLQQFRQRIQPGGLEGSGYGHQIRMHGHQKESTAPAASRQPNSAPDPKGTPFTDRRQQMMS